MGNPVQIKPDLAFVKELQAVGGEDLKKCYQCATCSVACPLAPADNPFPRKEMVWASWGLKDKLLTDIDVWLCHNCQTCSDLCPRGARPGDLLAAIRNMTFRNLVEPKIVGDWLSSAKNLPIMIAVPAVLLFVVWFLVATIKGTGMIPAGEIVYGKIFPGDYTIDPIFTATFLFVVYTFYKGVKRLFASFDAQPKTLVLGHKPESWLMATIGVFKDEIVTHKKWNECGQDNSERFKGHLAIFYAFIALAIVTTIVAVAHWGGKIVPFLEPVGHTPMALYNPVKILANVGAIAGLFGLSWLTQRRLNADPAKSSSSFYDWYLLGVIWVVFLTGLAAELLRLAGIAGLAYPMYYIHLISVWMLFAYLPWSKLGHLVYRTAALVYARRIGRKGTGVL